MTRPAAASARIILGALAPLVVAAILALFAGPAAAATSTNGLAAIYQGAYDSLEVFWIDSNGAVAWVDKQNSETWWQNPLEGGSNWHDPMEITEPLVGIPGSAITAVYQVQNDQLEVFWVDRDGAVNDVWKDHNGDWHNSAKMTGPGFAPPGSPLAALWVQPYHQLHVFGLGADGALKMIYKTDNGKWNAPAQMTGPHFGVPGEQIATMYTDNAKQSLVFAVSPTGAISAQWKNGNAKWQPASTFTGPGVAPPGAALSAVYQPIHDHVEVFFVDRNGALDTLWRAGVGPFQVTTVATGFSTPGASVTAVYQDFQHHLEVFAPTRNGGVIDAWKADDGIWQRPLVVRSVSVDKTAGGVLLHNRLLVPPANLPDMQLAAVVQRSNNQMEVFHFDAVGALWDTWKANNLTWSSPSLRLSDVGGRSLLKAGACSTMFDAWGRGRLFVDAGKLTECARVMGIQHYCNKQGAYVVEDIYGGRGDLHRLVCVPYSHPDTIKQQAEHIARGVEEGASDALVAAAPYLEPAVDTASCLSGVIYGCAALAIDVATEVDRSDPVMKVARSVVHCASGDYVGCAEVGEEGLKEIGGPDIPAADVVQIGSDFVDCKEGVFAACARLGQSAAVAAGVPRQVSDNTADLFISAHKCLDPANEDSGQDCRELGEGLATVVDPSGKLKQIVNAADAAGQCANGDVDQCKSLGKTLSGQLAVPPGLQKALFDDSGQCLNNDASACIDIAEQAAQASGVPTDNVDLLRRCANGDTGVCRTLGQNVLEHTPLGDGTQVAEVVSSCAIGDVNACINLGRQATDLNPNNRVVGIVSGRGLQNPGGLGVARGVNNVPWIIAPRPILPATSAPASAPTVANGQCPAPEALIRQNAELLSGSAGQSMKSALVAGTLIQCRACDALWCLVADANPYATLPRKLLDFDFDKVKPSAQASAAPVAQQHPLPVPSQVPQVPVKVPSATTSTAMVENPTQPPSPAPATANFQGTWPVRSDKDWSYQFSIGQSGNSAWGTFVDQNGTPGNLVNASVSGQVLSFQWTETGGYAGTAQFTMAPGNTSFQGDYTVSTYPAGTAANLLHGTWATYTPVKSAPSTALPPDYGACCAAPKDEIDVR